MGTVIDPEMSDDLKVTVVATGLGAEAMRAPLQGPASPNLPLSHGKRLAVGGSVRREESRPLTGRARENPAAAAVGQEDYFDIPAFTETSGGLACSAAVPATRGQAVALNFCCDRVKVALGRDVGSRRLICVNEVPKHPNGSQ